MKLKGLLLLGVLLFALCPNVNAGNTAYGVMSIKGIKRVTIDGVGTFKAPVVLVLPTGNYTVRTEGAVKLEARVFVNGSRLVEVEFEEAKLKDLVRGNTTILGVKVTYNQWRAYPKLNGTPSLGLIGGCGGGVGPGYGTTKPYPMSLEDVDNNVAKLHLNNTILPCYLKGRKQNITGKLEYLFYTIAGPFGVSGVGLKNASFVTPLSLVNVNADVDYVVGYLFSMSAASMVTPFKLILPTIPEDFYNVTGVTEEGDVIRIEHVPKLDVYNLSVGVNHTLLTAVIQLKPRKRYSITYSLKTALNLIKVKEESVKLYKLIVSTSPTPAEIVINGSAVAHGHSGEVFYLPAGEYMITAFTNESGAIKRFRIPEVSTINLTLKPHPARLTLHTTPEDALVVIDGRTVNNTSVTLSPGEHQILVSANGYVAENLSVLLTPNESRTLRVALKRLPSLRIETKPAGALVRIKNTTCTSPCRLTLKPGSHTIEVSLNGYQNEIVSVYLNAGESRNVSITLEPVETQKTRTPLNPVQSTTAPATPTQGANFSTDASSEHSTALKLLLLGLLIVGLIFALKRR
ncbi:PEGA domain-containing protein [Thermococcus sp. 21S7]|uniref:PEGA domain-containing protein n=1 Tax=Thermococcus sp. 21S7 TaxID=1638221 RepID=UPI00143B0277|nr:PEGA domain-containing protein [Thermococcus sp. 21S7]NJE61540.1 PEGA domain-containing protein [Thermococcus sp. 21S7]